VSFRRAARPAVRHRLGGGEQRQIIGEPDDGADCSASSRDFDRHMQHAMFGACLFSSKVHIMRIRITLQLPDYQEQSLGKRKTEQAAGVFEGVDWEGLCNQARQMRRAGEDFCPPGMYLEFQNIYGHTIRLHVYVADIDSETFDSLETEMFSSALRAKAPRSEAPDIYKSGLGRERAANAIVDFVQNLAHKGLRITGDQHFYFAVPYSDFRSGLATLFALSFIFFTAACILLYLLLLKYPSIQPDWFKEFMAWF